MSARIASLRDTPPTPHSLLHSDGGELVLAVTAGGKAVSQTSQVDERGEDLLLAQFRLGDFPRRVTLLLWELRVVLWADKDTWLSKRLEVGGLDDRWVTEGNRVDLVVSRSV